MKRMQLTMQLRGLIRHDAEADVFVSYCPALQIHSQGESEAEAEKALASALHLYVSTCYEKGILERTLKQYGFAQVTETDPGDQYVTLEEAAYERSFNFNVPLHLLGSQQQQAVCV